MQISLNRAMKAILIFTCTVVLAVKIQAQPLQVDGIMAVVGDKVVLRSDFETDFAQLIRSGQVKDSLEMVCVVFRRLITRKMMLNQAEIDSLPLSEERIDAEIDNRLRYYQRQAGSQADLEKYLGKTLTEYKEEIRPKMKEQLLAQEMENKITGSIKISPQEVKQYYDGIPSDSLPVIPAEVEVAQLLVEPPFSPEAKDFAREQLEMLRRRILNGENFEKLARTYSQDPGSKDNGGLLPEFGRGEMVGEFERMAFKLKNDSLSRVFESPFGFHLMKVIKRKGERVLAAHILIRPEYTSADFAVVQRRLDSAYQMLSSKEIDWCAAVKRFASTEIGNKGNCGFFADELTGSQKMLLAELPMDTKPVVDKLKPGDVSAPSKTYTPDGRPVYRIIYLKSLTPPHQANLIQDYGRIQLEAESRKKEKAIEDWLEKNRKGTYIRLHKGYINCPDMLRWENQ